MGTESEAKGKSSWRTTALGVAMLAAALAGAAVSFLDGDPSTNVDMAKLAAAAREGLTLLGVLAGGVGLISAKDHKTE